MIKIRTITAADIAALQSMSDKLSCDEMTMFALTEACKPDSTEERAGGSTNGQASVVIAPEPKKSAQDVLTERLSCLISADSSLPVPGRAEVRPPWDCR